MSPFQVLKSILAALAQPASLTKPASWPATTSEEDAEEEGPALPPPPPPTAFKQASVFLLDPSGWLNLAVNVSASSLAQVRFLVSFPTTLPVVRDRRQGPSDCERQCCQSIDRQE